MCGELAEDINFTALMMDKADYSALQEAVSSVARLLVLSRGKVNVSFDKVPRDFADLKAYNKARKAYFSAAYASLRKEFGEEVLKIVKQINAAVPAEERAKFKGC